MTDREDYNGFVASIKTHLVPAALQQGFAEPNWIPGVADEVLCVMRGSPFDLLVYRALGHGINMTVTVAESSASAWNPEGELGLKWLCDLLGVAEWHGQRYGTLAERNAHIQELSGRLPELVSASRAYGPALWPDLRSTLATHGAPMSGESRSNKSLQRPGELRR